MTNITRTAPPISSDVPDVRFVEFDAVVMALDDRECLHPLADTMAVPTLPIGNQPMIAFSLHQVAQAGFDTVIVVVSQSSHAAVSACLRYIMEDAVPIKIRMEVVPNGIGSADALRRIRSLLQHDFLLVDSDIICTMPLVDLADLHRTRMSGATVLLNHMPELEGDSHKQRRKALTADIARHYAAIADDGVLMYIGSAVDIETEPTFNMSHRLLRRGSLTVQTRLHTTGIAFFARWTLDVLDAKKAISSVYAELLPYLVQKQFVEPFPWVDLVGDQTRARLARQMSDNFDDDRCPMNACYAMMMPGDWRCARVNTIPAYVRAQELLLQLMPSGIWPFLETSSRTGDAEAKIRVLKSLVASGATIGEGSKIHNSIIGSGCSIGPGVTITRSYLMDNVNVEANCELARTVICPQSVVGANSSLLSCVIGSSYTIASDSVYKNETLFNAH